MRYANDCTLPLDASYALHELYVYGSIVRFEFGPKGWQFTVNGEQDRRGFRDLETAQAKCFHWMQRRGLHERNGPAAEANVAFASPRD